MRSWERPIGLSLCALSGVWLVVACTLRVEMEVRSMPAPVAQGSAYTSPEHAAVPVDAGTYYAGVEFDQRGTLLTTGDGGVLGLNFFVNGCETIATNDAGQSCESPCLMPAVGYALRYDGCRWVAYVPDWRQL